jgi:FkbH-like protein
MPACYQTCDLFDETPTKKCRRFVDGVVPNRSAGTIPGGEIRFRKWAKLETQGNATMLPVGRIDLYERLLSRASAPTAHAGRLIHRLGGKERWLKVEEALHKRMNTRLQADPGPLRPDVFLAEITNPTDTPVSMIVTAYIDKRRMTRSVRSDQLPAPAALRMDVPPGFSRHMFDVDAMGPIFASGLPFNISVVPENDTAEIHLVFHRLDLGIRAANTTAGSDTGTTIAAPAKAAKLVIFDLDNTLWRGVLLEGDVRPLPGLVDLFRSLDERGILISVASKNAREDAMAKLTELGLDDYLLFPQIGWGAKSESVRRIITAIDIGADTVIFVDDNPFERAEVAGAVAGVEVLPETAISGLAALPRLQGATTAESRARRQMYKQAIARDTAAGAYGDDYLEFLRSCGITITIRRDTPEDFDRIAELVQRTNQLNFSGRKYAREETAAILSDPAQERHVIECADRFGSYGNVGFCLAHREPGTSGTADTLIIEDFMLSCRVQGKFVEQALIWHLAANGPRPVDAIRVTFRQTDRNKAAQMVLEKLGFALNASQDAYERAYIADDLVVDFMKIVTEKTPGAAEIV